MKSTLPRRRLLEGALAVAVLAWSPDAKSWVGGGQPSSGTIKIPSLDGELLTDATTLSDATEDFGHIVHRSPIAVLVPGSVDDIVKLVHFAHAHGIQVAAARGVGESHSTHGQSQVSGGVVIDMSALDQIHEINAGDALVDAGVRWIDLLSATTPLGKSPPTLTDYIGLSIGGTLSLGGIGGQTFRSGLHIDNVLELEVVTGKGHHVTCSPSHNVDLFNAVRGGLGQFGIIVRARVRLVDVPPMARTYTALYDDIAVFTSDQRAAIEGGDFDYVEGSVSLTPAGPHYQIELVKYYAPSAPPDDAALLAPLSFLPGTEAATDSTYFDFANRLAPLVAFLQQIGAWFVPHPWLDLFVPGDQVESFVQSVLATTTPADTGNGPILLYPFKRDRLTASSLSAPASETLFLFAVLRFAVPPTPAVVSAMLAQNRAIYDACVAIGGKFYPVDAVELTHADWVAHFGARYPAFAAAKALFDPNDVLTPGQGIF